MTIVNLLVSYNQEKYIYEALDGILQQTLQPDEVIIADDCSTDRTQLIITEYVRIHGLENKWKLLYNEKNVGINRNLQNAIDHTVADIIIPMAGDDVSLPNRNAVAVELFRKYKNLNVVTSSILKINSAGHLIGKLVYHDELRDNIYKTVKAGMPNVFPVGQSWRRRLFDTFGPLPVNVPNEDDQITFWGLLSGGIFCSSVNTVKYRVHSNSASAWLRNNQSDNDYFLRFLFDMPIRRSHMELWQQSLCKVKRPDSERLDGLIQLKKETYAFFENIEYQGFINRWRFWFTHNSVICVREKYYLLLGKLGVLSWRWLKKILRK